MADIGEIVGMIGVAILFGAFLGFVVPGGSIVGAAAGAGILSVLGIIYVLTVPQDRFERGPLFGSGGAD